MDWTSTDRKGGESGLLLGTSPVINRANREGKTMTDKLRALSERARSYEMTPEEAEKQRISFAYGNTNLENAAITREDVLRASQALRETRPIAER